MTVEHTMPRTTTSDEDRTFTRVTVLTPVRRLDVAVPDDMPVAELTRELLSTIGTEFGHLVLDHPVRGVLHPRATPADLQLQDGDVLTLRAVTESERLRPVDDVAESVAERTGSALAWSQSATHTTFAGLLGTWCLAGAVISSGVRPLESRPYALAMCLLVLLVAQLLAGRTGRARQRDVLAAFFVPTAAYCGWVLMGLHWPGLVNQSAAAVSGASAAAALVAVIDPARTWWARPILAAVGTVTPGLLLARFGPGIGWSPTQIAASTGVISALVLGLVTRSALATSGLLSLDTDSAEGTPVHQGDVDEGVRRAAADITAMLLGSAVSGTVAAVVLLRGDLWCLATGAVLTLVVLCRARGFRRRAHIGVLLVTPIAGLGAAILPAAATAPSTPLAPVIFAGGVPLAALMVHSARDIQEARLKVWVDRLEIAALVALVPLTLAVFDAYAQVYARFS